jgi:hypothetical protein
VHRGSAGARARVLGVRLQVVHEAFRRLDARKPVPEMAMRAGIDSGLVRDVRVGVERDVGDGVAVAEQEAAVAEGPRRALPPRSRRPRAARRKRRAGARRARSGARSGRCRRSARRGSARRRATARRALARAARRGRRMSPRPGRAGSRSTRRSSRPSRAPAPASGPPGSSRDRPPSSCPRRRCPPGRARSRDRAGRGGGAPCSSSPTRRSRRVGACARAIVADGARKGISPRVP